MLLSILVFSISASYVYVSVRAASSPVSHVVIIMQENHSFDNYFGTYPTANGTLVNNTTMSLQAVNGLPNGICLKSKTGCVSPHLVQGYNTSSPVEGQLTYENDYNDGRMDGFAEFSGPQSMGYFDYHQIAAYWVYAEEYGLAENYFASAMTTTTPNRLILFAGDSPVSYNYGPPPYAPYRDTILNQLSSYGISWGYFDTLKPYGPVSSLYPFIYLTGLDSSATKRIQDTSTFFEDLSNGQLLSVSFVMSLGTNGTDEHPPSNVTQGEIWTVSVVNAIMQSEYWGSTAILLTWDEGGGYYDHVAPPQLLTIDHGFDHVLHGYGERVPLLVISPYSKENYVSSQILNHMSLIHFIEDNWNLPYLNQNVAESNGLTEFFDFKSQPRAPIVLGHSGPYNVSSFPAPIQIPFDKLSYSRLGTTSTAQQLATVPDHGKVALTAFGLSLVVLSFVVLYVRRRHMTSDRKRIN